ncbi:DUF739 family protein [Carnobacterium divergens]|uniref:DUF739 family protein n=1 Tax=Carnobacterium divergens TaxID=2748 RepID=UPI00107470DF|nr:DUF739 family protein [Carnobacterium divergens]TFI86941.1 DUF739 domain-containing protein [Carnobacterium divergens]
MCFIYRKLLGRITEIYGTQYNFSIAMGTSERTLSLKLNDKVPWKDEEIQKAIDLLGIPKKDIHKYFFETKVQEVEHSI